MRVVNGKKLIVLSDADGVTNTYVVRESDTSIEITAHLDPRSSQVSPVREMVSLVCAILPTGEEKFYAFKLLRLVEERASNIEDRMTAAQDTSLDELPF